MRFQKFLAGTAFALAALVATTASAEMTKKELEEKVDALDRRMGQIEGQSKDSAAAADNEMNSIWKDGVQIRYQKKGIDVSFGAFFQNDWLWWTGDQRAKTVYGEFDINNPFETHLMDGTEIRRARLSSQGTLYEVVPFKFEVDFADGVVEINDMYTGVQNIPGLGTVLIGHMKEPFSLEELTSDRYGTFMERGLPNAFAPKRNVGLLVKNNAGDFATWAVGVFRDTNSLGFGTGDREYSITTRITAAPLYAEGGEQLIHIGGSFSYRNPKNDVFRIASRPEQHLAPNFVDTRDPVTGSDIQTDGVKVFGGEAAMVFGPFSLQGEYVAALVDVLPTFFTDPPANTIPIAPFPWSNASDAFFQSWYVYASYFLTGEHRPYKTSEGVFSRVKPKSPFLIGKEGWGAWEIAARMSALNLSDHIFNSGLGATAGNFGGQAPTYGDLYTYTLALNWYLNPNARVLFNYVLADPDPNGIAHLFGTRFQFDF